MDNTLLVPMQLDALVANNELLRRDTLRAWTFNYPELAKYRSTEPLPFNNSITGQTPGIYLHWTLPRSLRTAGNGTDYPLVPNRWLILRLTRHQSNNLAGWVLESDCPTSAAAPAIGATAYLVDPAILSMWQSSDDSLRVNAYVSSTDPTQVMVANLGVPFDINQWKERAKGSMFLTAVAPGNEAFSEYMYHNMNIFSFYDDLKGINKDTVSYFVTGWYADVTKDIAVGDVLTALNWTIANNGSATGISSSLYTGNLFSIGWDRNGSVPGPDQLQTILTNSKLNVSIGNNTIDAFSTLLGKQLADYEDASQTIALLRAFQYDLLPLLNEVNGDALLEQKVRDAWFQSKPGGTRWIITPQPSVEEVVWLQQLNTDQQDLDNAMEDLYSLQWQLNAAWWKRGHIAGLFPPNPNYNAASFDPLLDPDNPDSLLFQTLEQIRKVNTLLAQVPSPGTQDVFLANISAFVLAKGLSAGKTLKAVAQPRYWKANNPVVVVSGVVPSDAMDTNQSLTVRLESQLVSSFKVNGTTVNTGALEKVLPVIPNIAAFPPAINALFLEFYLLDPGNAAAIAQQTGQPVNAVETVMSKHDVNDYMQSVLPGISLANWAQGWNPMYMEWKVNYNYVPFSTNGKQNWIFNGTDYTLAADAVADGATTQIGNISLLSPHAQNIFGSRLKNFITTYGDQTQLTQLYNWIEQVDNWQFLSQELVNFGDMLTQRDGRTFRRPNLEQFTFANNTLYYADASGFQNVNKTGSFATPPTAVGHVNTVPYILNDVNVPFHGLREGQIYFTDLMMYDKFGRVLNLILSGSGTGLYDAKNFPLIRDQAMNADQRLTPNINAPAQLPPRINQFAKLDMLFTDQFDDNNTNDSANPICGWIIPNHPDQSLLVYAADGTSLGELSMITPLSGPARVTWTAPPHSAITIVDLQSMAPHVALFINNISGSDATTFSAFMEVIDSTLWTVDPLGDRSDQDLTLLIGRPLAMVRSTLQFSVEGQPLTDVGWASTFNPPAPDFTSYNFSIRLGDLLTREDGVIGYFTHKDYSVFNSVAQPAGEQNYVQQIGGNNYINLQFNDNSKMAVTILVDPRASIHATTGILPVKEIKIPPAFTDDPLQQMEVTFRSGPVLTQLLDTSITLLPLAEQNGSWTWWEKYISNSAPGWRSYDLANVSANANMKDVPSVLREGLLQFTQNK
ncbi:hypothetical protein [Chitinophaga sancti]|uniref:Uncharacterized protein n=1 Tax=Chitinophaga sancti TaxID=1004 RepID=A0A1K1RSD3_9BACT|nr:hypothetical protein [Chitinophaga sancti]WQD62457.1 hypothetical protein U0033_31690 [Chitinophaga sancti]WQG91974.1 hypothetical protein SR876_10695 [Chitinophaga sancti]SFW74998.1 hypothetical protein SAMN05661012_04175 [Chitinophaga sancti]